MSARQAATTMLAFRAAMARMAVSYPPGTTDGSCNGTGFFNGSFNGIARVRPPNEADVSTAKRWRARPAGSACHLSPWKSVSAGRDTRVGLRSAMLGGESAKTKS